MDKLKELLEESLGDNLKGIVISNSRNKDNRKITIRPVLKKDKLLFQSADYVNNKVYHNNYGKEELIAKAKVWLQEEFKQMWVETAEFQVTVLSSKKGKITIGKKTKHKSDKQIDLSHNRKKKYILEAGTPVEFLVDLGVMSKDGHVKRDKYDKFRQINRFLEFVRDVLPFLEKDKEQTILDFGCGKSYLTFAMYHYLKVMNGYSVKMIGLDLKEDVISSCNQLAEKYGYQDLKFLIGDIADYQGVSGVDMVVTLHACDTATDYALAKAVKWGAKVILSVPCCQHELNKQMVNDTLQPVLKYGLLKERMAALFTDGIRAELLEEAGYSVQLLEFIDMEHTPKNILIRAVCEGKKSRENEELDQLIKFLNVRPSLKGLLDEQEGVQKHAKSLD